MKQATLTNNNTAVPVFVNVPPFELELELVVHDVVSLYEQLLYVPSPYACAKYMWLSVRNVVIIVPSSMRI
jgi:hypothetical protein